MTNFGHITRADRVRRQQKDTVGSGKLEVTFQIPIDGTARTGMAVSSTETLYFGVGFFPQGGEKGLIDPIFRSGFSIRPSNASYNARTPLGFVGFANCPFFEYNDDGLCIGAICHVGVINLGADTAEIPFTGYVNLSFVGHASKSPLDSGNLYQYTGPGSVSMMERPAEDEG